MSDIAINNISFIEIVQGCGFIEQKNVIQVLPAKDKKAATRFMTNKLPESSTLGPQTIFL